MIYMNSSSSNNGEYKLTVTFATGTDPDMALVRVQNRVSQVTPQLPAEVVAEGVTVETAFSDILAFLAIISPNGTHSELDLSNYAHANIKNVLKRVPGMATSRSTVQNTASASGSTPCGSHRWGLSIGDVAAAIESQNKQASIGSVGAMPSATDSPMVYTLMTKGGSRTIKI